MRKNLQFFCIFLLIAFVLAIPKQSPVIGIYTQQDTDDEPTNRRSSATLQSYIAASYVKYIQMSGAQVVPIFAYSNQSQIAKLLPKINGVLFPGGGAQFSITNRWTSNADFILKYAIKQNQNGNPFPVWGTCLGMQLLAYLTSGYDSKVLTAIRGEVAVLNKLKFTGKPSYIFDGLAAQLYTKLTTGTGVTYFNHHWAVTPQTILQNSKLNQFWSNIAQTTSSYNQVFVSHFQAKKYPFFGVQFHPQKSVFEWKVYSDKSADSVQIVQIMSNKFVDIARKSKNQFATPYIYNYQTSSTTMSFTRIYLFNETKPANQNHIKGVNWKYWKNKLTIQTD